MSMYFRCVLSECDVFFMVTRVWLLNTLHDTSLLHLSRNTLDASGPHKSWLTMKTVHCLGGNHMIIVRITSKGPLDAML